MNTLNPISVPIHHPTFSDAFKPEYTASRGTSNRFPVGDPDAARKAYRDKRAEWAKLDLHADTRLRQIWADETFMRAHISAAGLRVSDNIEPATVTRLRSLLRKVGIQGPEIGASVGTDLVGFLKLNPLLPLWAAVALVLESTGRFLRGGGAD